MNVHRYRAELVWAGSTARGYERYDRTHRVVLAPSSTELVMALVHKAHDTCFIARSLRTEIRIEPEVKILDGTAFPVR